MKKTISAILAVATVAGSLATALPAANAQNGNVAAGVAAGVIGGALLGGAIANSNRPYGYGYGYAPEPVYVEPACRVVREQYFDGYGYRWRRVRVCD